MARLFPSIPRGGLKNANPTAGHARQTHRNECGNGDEGILAVLSARTDITREVFNGHRNTGQLDIALRELQSAGIAETRGLDGLPPLSEEFLSEKYPKREPQRIASVPLQPAVTVSQNAQ